MSLDDLLPGMRPVPGRDARQRLKAMVRERWRVADEVSIMVTELSCHEPGCTDVETVIALLGGASGTVSHKVPKPMDEVSGEDLDGLS